jgi:hypothetical protein
VAGIHHVALADAISEGSSHRRRFGAGQGMPRSHRAGINNQPETPTRRRDEVIGVVLHNPVLSQ